MSSWINVARIHLVDRTTFTVTPWGTLAFCFGVNLVLYAATSPGATGRSALSGFAFCFYGVFGSLGALTARSLPLGLALGVSRRSYYIGSTLLCLSLAAGYGLALALLQVIERATGGWGWTCTSSACATSLPGHGPSPGSPRPWA